MKMNTLKDYLGVVADMEKERYMQNNLYNYLQQHVSRLGIPSHIPKPIHPVSFEAIELLGWLGGGALYGFIGGGIICFLFIFLHGEYDGFFHNIFVVGLIFAVIAVCGVVIYAIHKAISNSSEYNLRYQEYIQACSHDRTRVENELKEREFFIQQLNFLEKQMQETKDILNALYNKGIIYKKYHWNFVAVCTFYEYFDSQRFTELGEAYNQYELELRLDRITDKLDIIIAKLDEIIRIQYIIAQKIRESNYLLDKILDSSLEIATHVKEIEAQGQELNDYISKLQSNSEFMLYLTEERIKEQDYRKKYL